MGQGRSSRVFRSEPGRNPPCVAPVAGGGAAAHRHRACAQRLGLRAGAGRGRNAVSQRRRHGGRGGPGLRAVGADPRRPAAYHRFRPGGVRRRDGGAAARVLGLFRCLGDDRAHSVPRRSRPRRRLPHLRPSPVRGLGAGRGGANPAARPPCARLPGRNPPTPMRNPRRDRSAAPPGRRAARRLKRPSTRGADPTPPRPHPASAAGRRRGKRTRSARR